VASDQETPFSRKLRRLRSDRGLSVRQLADFVHHGKTYINELERGLKRPTAETAKRLDEALRADGQLVKLAPTAQVAQPDGAIPRQAAEPDAPMDDDDLERLHDTVRHLVALDTLHGSEGLYASAARAFRASLRRLAQAGAEPGVRADIHAALAEVGEVAAWLAYDSDKHQLSRDVATEALLVADLAGDTSMRRFLMSHLAMQSVFLGRPAEALDLTGRVISEEPRSKRVIGMMRVRRARALGGRGQMSEALRELTLARKELAGGVGPDDPAWTWWWHAAELAVHEGRIRSAGGDLHGAVASSEQAVMFLPAGQGRDHALFRAWLLSDLTDVKAWQEADQVAWQLMERAPIVGSARVPRIIRLAERRAIRAGAPTWLVDAMREAAAAADPAA
jgi:transcriptional regulator with XRE-family HTH domain